MTRAVLVAWIFLASPAAAGAQDVDRDAAIRALHPGASIRLDVTHVGRLEGRFIAGNTTTLTLAGQDAQVRVPDIERLWIRGRATGKGALIGAGVGVALGVVGGLLLSTVACEPVDGGDCTAAELAAVTGLIAGAGGAVLGAGIGFAIPTWHLRFP